MVGQHIEDRIDLGAGNAKDVLDPLRFQALHQQFRTVSRSGHMPHLASRKAAPHFPSSPAETEENSAAPSPLRMSITWCGTTRK
jgi:hypothetical protein